MVASQPAYGVPVYDWSRDNRETRPPGRRFTAKQKSLQQAALSVALCPSVCPSVPCRPSSRNWRVTESSNLAGLMPLSYISQVCEKKAWECEIEACRQKVRRPLPPPFQSPLSKII